MPAFRAHLVAKEGYLSKCSETHRYTEFYYVLVDSHLLEYANESCKDMSSCDFLIGNGLKISRTARTIRIDSVQPICREECNRVFLQAVDEADAAEWEELLRGFSMHTMGAGRRDTKTISFGDFVGSVLVDYDQLCMNNDQMNTEGLMLGDSLCDSAVDAIEDDAYDNNVIHDVSAMAEIILLPRHHCTEVASLSSQLHTPVTDIEPGIDVMQRYGLWSYLGLSHIAIVTLTESPLLTPYFKYIDESQLEIALRQLFTALCEEENILRCLLLIRLQFSLYRRSILSIYGRDRWNCGMNGMPLNQHVMACIVHACYRGATEGITAVFGESALSEKDVDALYNTWRYVEAMLGIEKQYSLLNKSLNVAGTSAAAFDEISLRICNTALKTSQCLLPARWKWSLKTQYAYVAAVHRRCHQFNMFSAIYMWLYLMWTRLWYMFVKPTEHIMPSSTYFKRANTQSQHIKSE